MLRLRRHKSVSDPVAVVNRFVDAANRHDAAGIAKCLHPDFESIQPVYPSRNFRGSDQVRRNWQAIFTSEPGFRLSLVRSAASEGTVWVELHGAGGAVEVAGVFIMGVEDDLVRWARVYSAVVEQPAPVVEGSVEGPELKVVASSPKDEAEELRQMIEAGREAAGLTAEPAVSALADEEDSDDEDEDDSEVDAGATAEADGDGGQEEAEEEDAEVEKAEDEEAATGAADEDSEAEATAPADDGDDDSPELDDAVAEVIEIALADDTAPSAAPAEDAPAEPVKAEVLVDAGGEDGTPPVDDGVSTEVRAAVAEVQALAEVARPRRSRNRKRPGRTDGSPAATAEPENKPETDAGEADDATRVRAAARAATSKAAAQPQQKEPGTGGTPRKPRNKGNR